MSTPLEHDYIGLSGDSSMDRSSDKISSSFSSNVSPEDEKHSSINLKGTELRLGLPGSESPERKAGLGVSLFGKNLEDKSSGHSLGHLKKSLSGTKRGVSDTVNGSDKWVFSANGGTEADLGRGACLLSPRGGNRGLEHRKSQESYVSGPAMKEEVVTSSPKFVKEKGGGAPATRTQVVGWPPIRSFRKSSMATNLTKNGNDVGGKSGSSCIYVKVSMDGAPYLRKVDLKTHSNYSELSSALEKMFSCFTIGQCASHGLRGRGVLSKSRLMNLLHGSQYALTYEDRDGDWMLVGDVPWEMFTNSCKRLRIMNGSEAIGLAPRAMEKCKSQNCV